MRFIVSFTGQLQPLEKPEAYVGVCKWQQQGKTTTLDKGPAFNRKGKGGGEEVEKEVKAASADDPFRPADVITSMTDF